MGNKMDHVSTYGYSLNAGLLPKSSFCGCGVVTFTSTKNLSTPSTSSNSQHKTKAGTTGK